MPMEQTLSSGCCFKLFLANKRHHKMCNSSKTISSIIFFNTPTGIPELIHFSFRGYLQVYFDPMDPHILLDFHPIRLSYNLSIRYMNIHKQYIRHLDGNIQTHPVCILILPSKKLQPQKDKKLKYKLWNATQLIFKIYTMGDLWEYKS